MHKLNIFVSAPASFQSTLDELKPYLKFNINSNQKNIEDDFDKNFDGLICHEDNFKDIYGKIEKLKCFKILATSKKSNTAIFDYYLKLPTTIKEINDIVESSAAKKKFYKNSSIKIKSYLLDKNEKKLIKEENFIILTEKEIQLLELFLTKKKAISKNNILDLVWNYSSDADTHTVETHIYRLRKKINDKFLDNNFILNNKNGYYL